MDVARQGACQYRSKRLQPRQIVLSDCRVASLKKEIFGKTKDARCRVYRNRTLLYCLETAATRSAIDHEPPRDP